MKVEIGDVFRHGFSLSGSQDPDPTSASREMVLYGEIAKEAISGFATAVGIPNRIHTDESFMITFHPQSSTYWTRCAPNTLEMIGTDGSIKIAASGVVTVEYDREDIGGILSPVIYDCGLYDHATWL